MKLRLAACLSIVLFIANLHAEQMIWNGVSVNWQGTGAILAGSTYYSQTVLINQTGRARLEYQE